MKTSMNLWWALGLPFVCMLGSAASAQVATNLYQSIPMGVGSGEVVAHTKVGSDFYIAVTDNPNGGVSIFRWVSGTQKYQLERSLDIAGEVSNFDGVSSVALDPRGNGLGVAAVQIDDPAYNTINGSVPQIGFLVFFNVITGDILGTKEAGYHPDMVGFSSTGVLGVANEGEFAWNGNDDTPVDPAFQRPGSVSLYDLSAATSPATLAAAVTAATEVEIDFSGANLAGIRYGTPEEMEPEYVAFSADGSTLFAGCQENNAIAVLDNVPGVLANPATASWVVSSLGTVTYVADASDRDGPGNNPALSITQTIKGLHMPDAIAAFEQGGTTYVVTADEGDARPDDSDIARAGSFSGSIAAGSLLTSGQLTNNDLLNRINISLPDSLNASDEIVEVVNIGARGISVWAVDSAANTVSRVSHLSLET